MALCLALLSGTAWLLPSRGAGPVSLTLKGTWPGYARGLAQDVAVQGQYAYVAAAEGGLVIFDVSDPANPVRVGGYDTGGYAEAVAIAGDFACVADWGLGLQVIDVSNPAKPVHVGGYNTGGWISGVAVAGSHAYMAGSRREEATWIWGLHLIDISDPANPVRVGGYDSGYAHGVAVSGHYAYVAGSLQEQEKNRISGLQVIDVSNPANPVRVGGYDSSGSAYGVAVSGNYAYVADGSAGLQVLDVSNPANPVRVGGYDTSGYALGVAVSGIYAYVADESAGLQVLDMSNPANPVRVGGYDTSGYALGVAVSGIYAYVADGGEFFVTGEGLVVIGISNPANPVRVGDVDTSGYALGVAVSGNHAYVADGSAGLQVLDLRNPANPVRVGAYDTGGWAWGVAIAGDYAYVADRDDGLQVLDVSIPANPVRVGGYDTGNWQDPFGMPSARNALAVSGSYAYVADESFFALQVIDIGNPANPVRVGAFKTSGWAYGLAVADNHAYLNVSESEGGELIRSMQVIDVSDPANPVHVGGYETSGSVLGVVGNYAYVADGEAVLQVLDVSNPANPVRVGGYDTSGSAGGVAVVGTHIYVADGRSGLVILEQSAAPPPPADWVRIQTDQASTPRARHNHAMVYDEQREVVLMHGGRLQDGAVLSDTWQWDGQSWTQVATDGPRVFQHSMTYDPSRGLTVLYGGRTAAGHANPIGDTWEWDGKSWNLIEVGRTTPPPPVMGGMAYDPERKKVVRQGGITAPNDTFDVGATWEWDGKTWTQIADGFVRGAHTLLFDPIRRRMLTFGGSSTSNTSPSPGTWEFEGGQWNLITTAGPSARFTFDRALVWDSARNVGVLCGGATGAAVAIGDTWEWNGAAWSTVIVSGPGPRAMHAMAYDSKRRKVVLFGGYRDCFRCEINETWEYGLAPLKVNRIDPVSNGLIEIRWSGEALPYQLQSCSNLAILDWQNEGEPTDCLSATLNTGGLTRFFRVLSLFGSEKAVRGLESWDPAHRRLSLQQCP